MKKFTCPCFVLVENAERHKELIKLLDSIGYDKSPIQCSGNIIGVESQGWFVDTWVSDCENIDCGTNVELFKTLAAMNDNDDYMQWFTNGWIWVLVDNSNYILGHSEGFNALNALNNLNDEQIIPFHKATKEEIINYFTK